MIIKPRVKGFICTTSHPVGCKAHVQEQIEFVQKDGKKSGAKNVLVIGASNGYGLASRIEMAFGYGADTLGLFFEREPTERKTGSGGWYNAMAFEQAAKDAGLYCDSMNGDAFSNEMKQQTVEKIQKDFIESGKGKIDLVVYSLAAPRIRDDESGEVIESVLKPIGSDVETVTLDTVKKEIKPVAIEQASEKEIEDTVKVMGGTDWKKWIAALKDNDLLAEGAKTVAYTYIGEKITKPIYGDATIGQAKKHVDQTATELREMLTDLNGDARVCVLKALVTQSSSAIPIMPLYISLLYRVMKENGTHEGCIEQIHRLMNDRVYADNASYDEENRLRVDELEMKAEVQAEVERRWDIIKDETIDEYADADGYQADFLKLFGFGFEGVDYDREVSPLTGDYLEESATAE